MKSKFKKFILFLFLSLIILTIAYTFIKPIVISKCMDNNYYSKEKQFNNIKYFVSINESALFIRNGFPTYNKDTTTDKVKKQLRDSLYILLRNINCEGIIHDCTTKDSIKIYVIIYHKEFLFADYAYLISVGNKKPLNEIITSDGFYESHWLNSNVLAGTLKWN